MAPPRITGPSLAVLTVLALTGCSLLGTSRGGDPEWAEDPDSGRFFRPEIVMQSTELLQEHFPTLGGVQQAALTEGRFTDPSERVPIPAPDDHWWQAAVELDEQEVDRLLAANGGEASDGGGASDAEQLSDDAVLTTVVPTIEDQINPCPGGWVEVGAALHPEGDGQRTAAGDMIEVAALCADSGQLAISARDT